MSDDRTLSVYDARAADYADRFARSGPDPRLDAFLDALPPGGTVLDLGCGPGTAAARMAQRGFIAEATDASAAMVALAASHPGVTARLASFDDLDACARYDGVWASFSLLHAPRAAMPRHLQAIHRALRPDRLLMLGLKTGTGESRDALGRFYTFYTEPEITGLLAAIGFEILSRDTGEEVGLAGTLDPWLILTARRISRDFDGTNGPDRR